MMKIMTNTTYMTKRQKIGLIIFVILFAIAYGLAGRSDEQTYRELHGSDVSYLGQDRI